MPKAAQPNITNDEVVRILRGLEIVEIEVEEFSGKVHDRAGLDNDGSGMLVKLTESSRYEHRSKGETLVWHTYKVSGQTDEDKPHRFFELAVTFRIRYGCSEEFGEEFFKVFKGYSLRLQTSPFARAWIHDHCLRMGVPPLIMPLVRSA